MISESGTQGQPIFVSWVRYHSRSKGVADSLGIESHFVRSDGSVLLRYWKQFVETRRLVRTRCPSIVVVMQPPIFALLSVWITLPRGSMIVGDLHSGAFLNKRWKWALPMTLRLLRRRGAAIVTNRELATACVAAGVRTFVLHDTVTVGFSGNAAVHDAPQSLVDVDLSSSVLVPVTYANDEPIDAILTAAASAPELIWLLTGRAPESVVRKAPMNVLFTGYVTDGEYAWLMNNTTVTLALTDRPFTMQCAGYESMSAGKPLVTSRTETLVDYFGSAAVYTELQASTIADSVRHAVTQADSLSGRMRDQRVFRMREQDAALEGLRSWIGSHHG